VPPGRGEGGVHGVNVLDLDADVHASKGGVAGAPRRPALVILHELQPEHAELQHGRLDNGVVVLGEVPEPFVAGPGVAFDDLHPDDVAEESDGRFEDADGETDVVQHVRMLAWMYAEPSPSRRVPSAQPGKPFSWAPVGALPCRV